MSQAALPQEVERQVNIGKALELRIAGANYRQIANALKVGVGTAYAYVNEGLEELRDANAETIGYLRRVEAARLDSMLVSLWSRRDNPRTADTILRICERRARLLGLDAVRADDDFPASAPAPGLLPATISIVLVSPDARQPIHSHPDPRLQSRADG